MKSTKPDGSLRGIEQCYLCIPGATLPPHDNIYKTVGDGTTNRSYCLLLDNLPEITDTKHAIYGEENVIGRASPVHVYSWSGTRQISIQFHFFITQPGDNMYNLACLRAIASCIYPQPGSGGIPFVPPVICSFRCGNLLANNKDVCVVLQQYSVQFPTDVAWDEETFCPMKFDINTNWWVVYTPTNLPTNKRIMESGW